MIIREQYPNFPLEVGKEYYRVVEVKGRYFLQRCLAGYGVEQSVRIPAVFARSPITAVIAQYGGIQK